MAGATGFLAGMLAVAGWRVLGDGCGQTPFTHATAGLVAALALATGLRMGGCLAKAGPRGARISAWVLFVAGCWGLAALPAAGWLAHRWLSFLDAPGRTVGVFLAALPLVSFAVLGIPMLGIGGFVRQFCPARRIVCFPAVLFVAGAAAGAWIAAGRVLPEGGIWEAGGSAAGLERVLRGSALWAGALAGLQVWGARQVGASANGPGAGDAIRGRRGRRLLTLLPAILAAALAMASSGPSVPVLSLGLFGRWAGRHDGFSGGVLLRHTDGRRGTVSLAEHPDFGRVLLRNGGAVAYGTRYRSGRILAAHIPLFLHTGARRVALAGPAAGALLPSVRTHPLERIDCMTDEVRLAAWAGELNPDPATNRPARSAASAPAARPETRVSFQSGTGAPEGSGIYDIVWIATAPAWESGAADVLRPRFLKRSLRCVADEGLVALYLDARGFTGDDFRSALRGFHDVFPRVQVWCLGSEQWLWIGRAKPIRAPADRMVERLDVEPVFRDLLRAGVRSVPEWMAGFVCDTDGVESLTAGSGSLSPLGLAWHGLRSRFGAAAPPSPLADAEPARSWRLDWFLPGQMDPDLYVALLNRIAGRLRGRTEAVQSLLADASGAGGGAAARSADFPDDALTRERLDKSDLEARRLLARHDLPGAIRRYENMLRLAPDLPLAHYGMAMAAREGGQAQSAFRHLALAVRQSPENALYRLELGRTALQVGEIAEAVRQLRLALAREPANAEAMLLLSRARAAGTGADRDVQEALRLARRAYALTRDPEYAWNLADRYIDAGEARTGVELKRRLRQAGLRP